MSLEKRVHAHMEKVAAPAVSMPREATLAGGAAPVGLPGTPTQTAKAAPTKAPAARGNARGQRRGMRRGDISAWSRGGVPGNMGSYPLVGQTLRGELSSVAATNSAEPTREQYFAGRGGKDPETKPIFSRYATEQRQAAAAKAQAPLRGGQSIPSAFDRGRTTFTPIKDGVPNQAGPIASKPRQMQSNYPQAAGNYRDGVPNRPQATSGQLAASRPANKPNRSVPANPSSQSDKPIRAGSAFLRGLSPGKIFSDRAAMGRLKDGRYISKSRSGEVNQASPPMTFSQPNKPEPIRAGSAFLRGLSPGKIFSDRAAMGRLKDGKLISKSRPGEPSRTSPDMAFSRPKKGPLVVQGGAPAKQQLAFSGGRKRSLASFSNNRMSGGQPAASSYYGQANRNMSMVRPSTASQAGPAARTTPAGPAGKATPQPVGAKKAVGNLPFTINKGQGYGALASQVNKKFGTNLSSQQLRSRMGGQMLHAGRKYNFSKAMLGGSGDLKGAGGFAGKALQRQMASGQKAYATRMANRKALAKSIPSKPPASTNKQPGSATPPTSPSMVPKKPMGRMHFTPRLG